MAVPIINPWQGSYDVQEQTGRSLANLGNTMRQVRLDSQDEEIRQRRLADLNAQQGAKQQFYGAEDLQSTYLKEMQAQKAAAEAKADSEHLQRVTTNLDHFKKVGMDPKFITEYTKKEMEQNPKFKGLAQYVTNVDPEKIEMTKPVGENEIPDPMKPGAFLPPGTYKMKFARTGDPAKPFAFSHIEPIVEKIEYKSRERKEGGTVIFEESPDGGKTWRQVSRAPRYKGEEGGGRSGGAAPMGKAPSGYRYTPDGNLEAIPGGPAAIKAAQNMQQQGSAQATFDETIAVIDKLANHPGRAAGTGLSSLIDPRNYTPGTDARDFRNELKSFDGKLFLANVSKMKGLGALSDAEGKKLTAAAGAIMPDMSDKAFLENIKIIQDGLRKAKERIESGNMITAPPQTSRPAQGRPTPKKDPLGIL